ncbi:MAG: DNA cytosine methyltransferase [Candidatus Methanomethylicia archaeon]|nr:DNA cytosine methyltransferase [Candidatus Methanomethylicia archaeon]
MATQYTAVDLFCGAGGLTLGFKMAEFGGRSFRVLAAVDNWKCAIETYRANHPEAEAILGDIRDEGVCRRLLEITGGRVDVVIGGPPCEAFSLAGKRDPNDPRARLFYDYVKVVGALKPYICVMENVRGILTMVALREDLPEGEKARALAAMNELLDLQSVGKRRRAAPQYALRGAAPSDPALRAKFEFVRRCTTTASEAVRQALAKEGYEVAWRLLNAADYGVPQERKRVFFIGARNGLGLKVRFPEPTHARAPRVDAWGRRLEGWRTLRDAIGDLPPLEERAGDEVYNGGFSSIFMSRNRVMDWGRPSYTILASARHILLHPDSPQMVKVGRDERAFAAGGRPRRLSVRECARIQTFPDWYKFVGGLVDKYALIGDAVPPLLARRVAEAVLQSLAEAGLEPQGEG